ncbi:hypothetical protein [Sphingobium estronivorans]|uniref:hypothetical protein n=1 Tax=Sphingobium estronivorans TaxID=1577690 RepID=UPI001238816A|nr:hypothetical protein [Sphingobium estronivorans]
MTIPPLRDEEVADFVLTLTSTERRILGNFVDKRGRLYRVIAEKAGVSYAEAQSFGMKLQKARLAHISVIPFDGCRLFLNHRGEQVKHAAELLEGLQKQRAAE